MLRHTCMSVLLAVMMCGTASIAYAQENVEVPGQVSELTMEQSATVPAAGQKNTDGLVAVDTCPLTAEVFSDEGLLSVLQTYDLNADGALSAGECTTLTIDGVSIGNVQGINRIPGLETLEIRNNKSLGVLDLSGCTTLTTVRVEQNMISQITFPEQTLTELVFFDQKPATSDKVFAGWSRTCNADASLVDYATKDAVVPADVAGATLYAVWTDKPVEGGLWENTNGGWRYTLDGQPLPAGIHEVDGKTYWFNPDGYTEYGWYVENGNWSYFDPARGYGEMVQGWVNVDGQNFYMDEHGIMQSGWLRTGEDVWYYLNEQHDGSFGAALTGWQKLDAWYFFDNDTNKLHYGWLKDQGYWYYFDEQHNGSFGAMQTGWVSDPSDNDLWYYLWSDGSLNTDSWLYRSGTWYYSQASGALVYGWDYIDGYWYHFDTSHNGSFGAMQTGWYAEDSETWYYLRSSGAMETGWFYDNGNWFNTLSSGAIRTGWLEAPEGWYGFNPHHDGSFGAMIVGSERIDGKAYYFDTNGLWHSPGSAQQNMINKAQGYSSSTNWMLMVDTTNCWVGVFYNYDGTWEMEKLFRCSVGAPGSDTPTGQYSVTGKGYSFGHGYTCYYYTQFYGDYLFHSVTYYQGTFNIMEGAMGAHISAGCVRLEIHNAKWIYDNIPYGTRVVNY